jgi:hypothetical protein
MEPLLNCPENKEYNLSGSYIERTPQAESIRTRRFESQIRVGGGVKEWQEEQEGRWNTKYLEL